MSKGMILLTYLGLVAFQGIGSSALAQACPITADHLDSIVIVGIGGGGGPTSRTPHGDLTQLRLVDVTGDPGGGHVVLVLSSYWHTHWHIASTLQSRIKGVIAYGYHEVSVGGVAASAPISTYFFQQDQIDKSDVVRAKPLCGMPPGLPREGGAELEKLYLHIEQLLGRPADKFFGGGKVSKVDIDEVAERRSFPEGNIPFYPPDDQSPLSGLPSGMKGIEILLERGHVRRAKVEDFIVWTREATRNYKSGRIADFRLPSISPSEAFVAQTKIDVPKNLNRRTFNLIIPKGVGHPTGNTRRINLFFEEDGSCTGNCGVW